MHLIDHAEQTRRSLQEAMEKLTLAIEKSLELIARSQAASGQSTSPPLSASTHADDARNTPPTEVE